MKDAKGQIVKSGDKIKTDRGAILGVEDINGELYMVNASGAKTHLDVLSTAFYVLNMVGNNSLGNNRA